MSTMNIQHKRKQQVKAKTKGASCLLDLRNAAVLRDYVVSTNNCAPGQLTQIGTMNNCQPPACGYDRPKDMLSIMGAVLIVGTAIGVIQSSVVFLPSVVIEYDAGFLEFTLVIAMTYLIMLLTTCLSYPIIEYAGHKLTTLFGMILVFTGLLLDSQVFHITILYVGNIFFIGVGAGLAYAATMCLPADLFRVKLTTALMLVSMAGPLGTIFYTWLCAFILDAVGYKWTKLLQAVLVLLFTLSIHVYPKTRLMYASGCDPCNGHPTDKLRECIYKTTAADAETHQKKSKPVSKHCEEDDEQSSNMLCVCICDLRLFGDRSFMLWACLVMVATFNFLLPYLTFLSYAETIGARVTYWYITAFCLGSLASRCAFIGNVDFTFTYNRTLFQGCMFVSGVMWIVLNWAVTFGWILVVCVVLGAIEGIICVVTSRVVMGTIPRRWLQSAWVVSIICHAIGMFIVTVFTAVVALRAYSYALAYIITGITQIIVSLLATLLPSEEDDGTNNPATNMTTIQNYGKTLARPGLPGRLPSDYFLKLCCGSGPGFRIPDRYGGAAGMMSSSFARSPGVTTRNTGEYKCKCAICSQYGCMPGCLPDCTPAGSLNCDSNNKTVGS